MLSGAIVRGFTLFLLIGLPLMAARNARLEEHIEVIDRARPALYLSAALTLLIVAGLTAIVATWQEIPPLQLGWTAGQPVLALGWGLAATGVGIRQYQRRGAVRMGGGELQSHLSTVTMPDYGRPFRTHGIEDRRHIVHPFLEGGNLA